MTALLIILRVIHIFSAVSWAGGAYFTLSVLLPTVQEAGPDGGKFMQRLAASGRGARLFAVASVLTTLTGVWLYWILSDGLRNSWPQTPSGIVLTIGALAGLAAFLHAATATLPATVRLGRLAKEMLARNGPPAPEQLQAAQALSAKVGRNSMISAAMVSVALLGMAAAEYFSAAVAP